MDSQTPTQTLSYSHSGGVKKEWTAVMRERKEEELSWPLIKRGFTEAQRRELREQEVINRHISAGLPVPLHLLLPIWKSVVSSLGPSSSLLIYKQYPSFLGYVIAGIDCKNPMDQEPGRCRRTDGKKWRCSRDVISEQKYCERHIHRGRQRSRKLVEPSDTMRPPEKSDPPRISVGLQLMTHPSSTVTVASRGCVAVTNHYSGLVASPGIGFSPKSVLRGREGMFMGSRAHAGFEPERCRRTDGKKWRCRREVVPAQKYCPRHMHRGAKRLARSSVPVATAPPPRPPAADPNTNLCISTAPSSPPPAEKSSSATSSDTTVTDTST